MDKTVTKSPVNNPNQSPSPELSPPPSDLRHVSPSHPPNNHKVNNSPTSPDPSPPSDLRHVSQSHPSETNAINENTIITSSPKPSKPRFKSPSEDSSPSSDLCHVSPSPPSQNQDIKNSENGIFTSKPRFSAQSEGSSPSSDLCHVSPSPPPYQNDGTKNAKSAVFTEKSHFNPQSEGSSPSSDLCHVSPSHSPYRNDGTKNAKGAVSEGSSSPSELCHVSPYPRRSGRGVRREKTVLRAARREKEVRKAALGFRVCGATFCLVSLAVMASDKDRGWALDSFYRYQEFRYCISVNVVGFLYSVAQTCDLLFTICTGKYVLRHQYRFYFDFALDQILTYLLMSASSSAATRVDDWESNWGKDQFPMMASISVGLSFMSFVALAASTLISGYALCTWSST